MPQQQSARHRVTLCFDIDDCLECFVSSSELMPKAYKQGILNRMPPLIFTDMVSGKAQHTDITLRLFTNRKDHSLDELNMRHHKTASAKDILNQIQDEIKSWLDPENSQLMIDSRFHVEQVFASRGGGRLNYDRSLYEISDLLKENGVDDLCGSGNAIANKNKIDLITTILHEVSMQEANRPVKGLLDDGEPSPHIVVFFDDRFSDDHDENINSVIDFLANTPEAIPQGLQLKLIQLDPYLDRKSLENYVNHIRHQCDYSKPDYITEDEHDVFEETVRQINSPARQVLQEIPHLMDYFLHNHQQMADQSTYEFAFDEFQKALKMKAILSGSGAPGRHFSIENCWPAFLIPVAKAYKVFLKSPSCYPEDRSPIPGFSCVLSNQSIFKCSDEADLSSGFTHLELRSANATVEDKTSEACAAKST